MLRYQCPCAERMAVRHFETKACSMSFSSQHPTTIFQYSDANAHDAGGANAHFHTQADSIKSAPTRWIYSVLEWPPCMCRNALFVPPECGHKPIEWALLKCWESLKRTKLTELIHLGKHGNLFPDHSTIPKPISGSCQGLILCKQNLNGFTKLELELESSFSCSRERPWAYVQFF